MGLFCAFSPDCHTAFSSHIYVLCCGSILGLGGMDSAAATIPHPLALLLVPLLTRAVRVFSFATWNVNADVEIVIALQHVHMKEIKRAREQKGPLQR